MVSSTSVITNIQEHNEKLVRMHMQRFLFCKKNTAASRKALRKFKGKILGKNLKNLGQSKFRSASIGIQRRPRPTTRNMKEEPEVFDHFHHLRCSGTEISASPSSEQKNNNYSTTIDGYQSKATIMKMEREVFDHPLIKGSCICKEGGETKHSLVHSITPSNSSEDFSSAVAKPKRPSFKTDAFPLHEIPSMVVVVDNLKHEKDEEDGDEEGYLSDCYSCCSSWSSSVSTYPVEYGASFNETKIFQEKFFPH